MSLREKTIRLAHANPELQPKILPLLQGEKVAFNKYDPNELLSALVGILEKHELDEVADQVKKMTPKIQKAWRNRER